MRPGSEFNAWCDYPLADVPHGEAGPLAGKTLAVKDIMQVAGYPNGWGQPTRLAEAEPDTETQSAVQAMLDAGAAVLGKAQCEELCFSLTGINAHYGGPVNGAAPERVTGGSSSGSVSLISNGIVDIATGSDTGGSVRGPASYCGLLGLRITHDRVSLDRTMPLAPSFDVFGWFTRDPADYSTVGDLLLGYDASDTPLTRVMGSAALDGLLLGDHEHEAYCAALEGVEAKLGVRAMVDLGIDIDMAYWAFRRCQAWEAWQSLGPWITKNRPDLGPGVKERFEFGRDLQEADYLDAKADRESVARQLESVMGNDGLLVFPTMPSCAPLKTTPEDELQAFREQALQLLCLSGNSGLPQITVPLVTVHGAPMGISLMGPKGSDKRLIALAQQILG
ncbi:MAG: amidase [Pseudomonadota bacterium]